MTLMASESSLQLVLIEVVGRVLIEFHFMLKAGNLDKCFERLIFVAPATVTVDEAHKPFRLFSFLECFLLLARSSVSRGVLLLKYRSECLLVV